MEDGDERVRLNSTSLRIAEERSSNVDAEVDQPMPRNWMREPAQERGFTIFAELPVEIRLQIWALALTPRIVRWIRKNEMNIFSAPTKSLPLFEVCQESREAAILYGSYKRLPGTSGDTWFSPIVDFLFFDPGWIHLVNAPHVTTQVDPLDSLKALLGIENVRNIMMHPNYTDDRKKPTVMFEKFPMLERILVAADERSIGTQSKFMLGTVYDIKLYYHAVVRRRIPDVMVPYIAVGCLGWVGTERRKMHHDGGDNRRLVAVCENHAQMMIHLNSVREEEWRFIQEHRSQPKLALNLRWQKASVDSVERVQSFSRGGKTYPTTPDLPSYSDAVFPKNQSNSDTNDSDAHEDSGRRNRWHRLKRWSQMLIRG